MNNLAEIKAKLQQILGQDIGIGVTDPKSPDEMLLPEERPAMARAVEKRVLEFTAGRVAARQAMSAIDHPPSALPMAPDRSPVWPDELVGSITHCDEICIALVAPNCTFQSVGIDVERDTPLMGHLEGIICSSSERTWLKKYSPEQRGYLVKRFFCAKESTYKALYPLTKKELGFEDVEVDFKNISNISSFSNNLNEKISGIQIIQQELIISISALRI